MEELNMKWDAFRSPPRSERIKKSEDFYLRWLQWIKVIFFIKIF